MKRQDVNFGIEPEEFNYNTVIEIQSSIILIISKLFKNNQFTINELSKKFTSSINEIQLKAHLEDLTSKNILLKNKEKYY